MKENKLWVGLIGLGDMGSGHLACIKSFPNVKIAALCDIDSQRLNHAQQALDGTCPIYQDYRELLNQQDIDAVFVSVPNDLHAQVTLDAFKAGKHVFLQKPLAHTFQDGKKILDASLKYDLIFQIGHVYRYSPFFRELIQWIDDGVVGHPVLLWGHEFREPFPQRDWFYDQKKSGGTFVEKNCHHVDVFNWITQDRPVRVVSFGGLKVLKPGTEIKCSYCPDPPKIMSQNTTVDHGWALIEYHRGAKANLGLSMFLRPPSEIWRGFELGVIGDSGKMIVGNVDQEIMILYGGESKEEKKEIKNPYQGKWHSGMREEHGAFFHSIETGKKPFADAQIAFDALKICAAAEESIQKQKIITL